MSLQEAKRKYLDRELWLLVTWGSLQHSQTYGGNVDEVKRKEFRECLHKRIEQLVGDCYQEEVSSEAHLSHIMFLQKEISQKFSNILKDGQIRLGILQKFVNLYLKYHWVLDRIPTPPHCPFDSIVIKKLKKEEHLDRDIKWTKMNSSKDYRALVVAAESAKGENKSIAEWELRVWLEESAS